MHRKNILERWSDGIHHFWYRRLTTLGKVLFGSLGIAAFVACLWLFTCLLIGFAPMVAR